MRIRLRKTVRWMLLLFVVFSTFVVGLSVFYLYAEAADFLFKPKQPTPETTTRLTTRPAPPPIFPYATNDSTTQSRTRETWQSECASCVQDTALGLCELIDGEYVNDIYGYVVTIPVGIEAMCAPAPAPNHGFRARIVADSNAVIYVDGSYDASFLNSTSQAASAELSYLREEYGESVVVLERKSARLGKHAAIRYKAQYTDTSTGVTMIEDAVITLSKDSSSEDEVGIIYSVKLRTPIYNHKANSAAFERILNGWRESETQ